MSISLELHATIDGQALTLTCKISRVRMRHSLRLLPIHLGAESTLVTVLCFLEGDMGVYAFCGRETSAEVLHEVLPHCDWRILE